MDRDLGNLLLFLIAWKIKSYKCRFSLILNIEVSPKQEELESISLKGYELVLWISSTLNPFFTEIIVQFILLL